jgi:hypothetical protein
MKKQIGLRLIFILLTSICLIEQVFCVNEHEAECGLSPVVKIRELAKVLGVHDDTLVMLLKIRYPKEYREISREVDSYLLCVKLSAISKLPI